jgi:predicted PurR-regulated permease PerM
MTREQLFTVFFFAVLAFLLYEVYRVFAFFLTAFAWAGVLTLVFFPLYQALVARLRRASVAAALMTLLVFTVLVGPIATFGGVAIGQGQTFYQVLQEKAASGKARIWLQSLHDNRFGKLVVGALPGEMRETLDLGALGMQGAQKGTEYLISQLGSIARNVFGFIVNFLIMLVMMFFFFRDGQKLYFAFRDLLPMESAHKDAIFGRLYDTLSAVVRGMAVTAALQGIMAGLAFWLLDLPFALFLGLASAVASFVPVGGAALVWIPADIYFFTQGLWSRGIILLLWGSLVISMVDNVVRPMVIGGRVNISTLFLFFGILGGLQAYGPVGVFVGPVLLATIVVVLRIYREDYAPSTG